MGKLIAVRRKSFVRKDLGPTRPAGLGVSAYAHTTYVDHSKCCANSAIK